MNETAITKAFGKLEKAHKAYGEALKKKLDAKEALENVVCNAFYHGWVPGKNDRERDGWLREAYPSKYIDLAIAEDEVTSTRSELEIAKVAVRHWEVMVELEVKCPQSN